MTQPTSKEQVAELSTQEENELICEKLLRWQPWQPPGEALQWKRVISTMSWEILQTPAFVAWADTGLILCAFERLKLSYILRDEPAKLSSLHLFAAITLADARGANPKIAIRNAALEYIRSQS